MPVVGCKSLTLPATKRTTEFSIHRPLQKNYYTAKVFQQTMTQAMLLFGEGVRHAEEGGGSGGVCHTQGGSSHNQVNIFQQRDNSECCCDDYWWLQGDLSQSYLVRRRPSTSLGPHALTRFNSAIFFASILSCKCCSRYFWFSLRIAIVWLPSPQDSERKTKVNGSYVQQKQAVNPKRNRNRICQSIQYYSIYIVQLLLLLSLDFALCFFINSAAAFTCHRNRRIGRFSVS